MVSVARIERVELQPPCDGRCSEPVETCGAAFGVRRGSGTGLLMAVVDFGARSGLRYSLLASAAVAAALTVTGDVADARRHHYRGHAHHAHAGRSHHHHARSEDYSPPFASIVVDGNS